MKFYKLKHIPTGLYFKPSKYRNKSNLSEKGKIYQGKKPSLEYVKDGYRVEIKGENRYQNKIITERYKAEEWEIIEFVMIPLEQYREWETRQKMILDGDSNCWKDLDET